MAYRHIVVLACGGREDDPALAVAVALAVQNQALVRVLPAFADISADLVALGQAVGTIVPQEAYEALDEASRALQDRILFSSRQACEAADIAYGPGEGVPRLEVERHDRAAWLAEPRTAALADLVIIGQGFLDRPGGGGRGLLEEALLELRVPVLVVRGDPDSLAGPAAIAWDGSVEAAHAVRAALPLLGQAGRTAILQHAEGVDLIDAAPAPEALARYLALHELGAAEVAQVEGDDVGQALLARARSLGAGLIVAGAFEHSRLRQAVFGGVTRDLIEDRDGPSLLLAH
ncbi:MAG: universal stress protein [Pseudomonadota bacterium]